MLEKYLEMHALDKKNRVVRFSLSKHRGNRHQRNLLILSFSHSFEYQIHRKKNPDQCIKIYDKKGHLIKFNLVA